MYRALFTRLSPGLAYCGTAKGFSTHNSCQLTSAHVVGYLCETWSSSVIMFTSATRKSIATGAAIIPNTATSIHTTLITNRFGSTGRRNVAGRTKTFVGTHADPPITIPYTDRYDTPEAVGGSRPASAAILPGRATHIPSSELRPAIPVLLPRVSLTHSLILCMSVHHHDRQNNGHYYVYPNIHRVHNHKTTLIQLLCITITTHSSIKNWYLLQANGILNVGAYKNPFQLDCNVF